MTTNVMLVCGDVSDQQIGPLLQLMEERGTSLYVVRLGNEHAVEGVESDEAMEKTYGPSDPENGLQMLVLQAEMLDNLLVESTQDDPEIIVAVFDVPQAREGDKWNWVESLLEKNVHLWWLEAWSDGAQVLVSNDEPGTILPVPAA